MGHPAASENRQLASPPKASRDSGGNPRTLRLPAHRGQAGPLISPGNRPSRRLRDVDLLLHFTVVGEKVANRSWKSGPHVHKSRQRLRFPLPLEIKNRRDAINQEAELRSTSVRLSMPPPAPPRELEGASHNRCGGRPYVEAQFRVVPATEGTRPAPQPLFSIQGVAIAPASAGALKARKNWEEPGKSTAFQVPWTASAQSDAIVFACHFPESIRFALAPARTPTLLWNRGPPAVVVGVAMDLRWRSPVPRESLRETRSADPGEGLTMVLLDTRVLGYYLERRPCRGSQVSSSWRIRLAVGPAERLRRLCPPDRLTVPSPSVANSWGAPVLPV